MNVPFVQWELKGSFPKTQACHFHVRSILTVVMHAAAFLYKEWSRTNISQAM